MGPCFAPKAHSLPLSPRVFSDRLVDTADMDTFVTLLSEKLGTYFDLTFHNLCPNKRSPIFGMCPAGPQSTVHAALFVWGWGRGQFLESCSKGGVDFGALQTAARSLARSRIYISL